ncbi:MAG TPA: acyl-CoA synthetase [Vineibacter sp.]|nr:acyl-CoA synthetase [Vineibacter sp.]
MMSGLIAGDRTLTYPELATRALKGAGGLAALGVGEDESVALMLRNDFALFEANMAAGMVGAYAVPMNWHATADEAGYILRDCSAKVLVVHADLLPQIESAIPDSTRVFVVPTPAEIATAYHVTSDNAALPRGRAGWSEFVAASSPLAVPPKMSRGSMIYTSGTTGRPKGVRRKPPTQAQMDAMMQQIGALWGLLPDPTAVVLMNGPMYHSAPAAYGMSAVRQQITTVLQPRFDAEDMLRLIEKHRVTHMHIVPTMFVRLLRLPDEVKRKYDVSSLRNVTHGAAPCPPEVKRAMIGWWGNVINEYYGATETGVVVWNTSAQALLKPGTVGKPVDGAVVRIVDEQGRDVKQGEVGEIYVLAPNLSDFTYNNADDKRREVALGELVTVGDVGYFDGDGYLFLCDRKRDMIISGGVNIYPAEIEGQLIDMPGVRDCAVFGIPDEEFGEAICAVVQPDVGHTLGADDVRAYLGQRLARFKLPKIVEFRDELPREDSGKIFKRKLRQPYWEKAGRAI